MLAHITFEKITGLSGTFEGVFHIEGDICRGATITFNSFLQADNTFIFTQNGRYVYLRPVETIHTLNYLEQFYYGVNFLITELEYGGQIKGHSQGPN